MKTSDHDLTLRALDRLPPEQARDLESKLADDPRLAAELRSTEDTVTAIWHAASPLVPAPAGSFGEIQARLHPVRHRRLLGNVIAMGGWAAALALFAVLLGRQQSARPVTPVSNPPPQVLGQMRVEDSVLPVAPIAPPIPRGDDAPQQRLRETVLALQQELRAERSGAAGPRIRTLRSPGASGTAVASDPVQALRDLLTAALTEELARRTELATTLTVETGWTPAAFAALPIGSVVRHRSFPVENFGDFGLLHAANGDFYDPATHLVWTPAADGGGYLGEMAPVNQDLTAFEPPLPEPAFEEPTRPTPEKPVESLPRVDREPPRKPAPSGYLVEGAADQKSTLIIGDLPTADPTTQLIASVDGGATTFPLSDGVIVPGPDGTGFASFNLPASLVGNMSMSGSTSFGLGSRGVSIIQVNSAGESTLILTTEHGLGGD